MPPRSPSHNAELRPHSTKLRFLTLRIVAAYRTVSFEAATVLARVPPIHLVANLQRRVFEKLRKLRENNE